MQYVALLLPSHLLLSVGRGMTFFLYINSLLFLLNGLLLLINNKHK